MPGDTFRCSRCRREFRKAWSDEEAQKELAAKWGKRHGEKLAVLCEDCFQEFHGWVEAYHPEWLKTRGD